MNIGQQMFLLAAKEKSFSRAAEKAFVTPQCLSDHIKRLEEQYQVVLFRRRPQLQLTDEGEILLRYLQRIQTLETSLNNELADSKSGVRGTVRLGIPSTRGVLTVPETVTRFRESYPQVDVQVYYEDTRRLEELLLDEKLDVMLGVDASQHVLFQRRAVAEEPIYIVFSEETLERRFGAESERLAAEFRARGADLRLFQHLPFVQGGINSTTTLAVRQHLLACGLELRIALQSSNFDVQAELCRRSDYATICSRFYVRRLVDLNPRGERPLVAFPVRGLTKRLTVEVITRKDTRPLHYLSRFAGILEEVTREGERDVCAWLADRSIDPEGFYN